MKTVQSTIYELKAQRAAMLDQIRLLDDAIKSLEQVVQKSTGVTAEARPSSSPPAPKREGPGTREAILTILSEAGRPLQDTQILQIMQQREWGPWSKTPLNALRASLSRLRRDGEIQRRERDGTYRLPRESEAPREQEASDPVSNQGGHMDPP